MPFSTPSRRVKAWVQISRSDRCCCVSLFLASMSWLNYLNLRRTCNGASTKCSRQRFCVKC